MFRHSKLFEIVPIDSLQPARVSLDQLDGINGQLLLLDRRQLAGPIATIGDVANADFGLVGVVEEPKGAHVRGLQVALADRLTIQTEHHGVAGQIQANSIPVVCFQRQRRWAVAVGRFIESVIRQQSRAVATVVGQPMDPDSFRLQQEHQPVQRGMCHELSGPVEELVFDRTILQHRPVVVEETLQLVAGQLVFLPTDDRATFLAPVRVVVVCCFFVVCIHPARQIRKSRQVQRLRDGRLPGNTYIAETALVRPKTSDRQPRIALVGNTLLVQLAIVHISRQQVVFHRQAIPVPGAERRNRRIDFAFRLVAFEIGDLILVAIVFQAGPEAGIGQLRISGSEGCELAFDVKITAKRDAVVHVVHSMSRRVQNSTSAGNAPVLSGGSWPATGVPRVDNRSPVGKLGRRSICGVINAMTRHRTGQPPQVTIAQLPQAGPFSRFAKHYGDQMSQHLGRRGSRLGMLDCLSRRHRRSPPLIHGKTAHGVQVRTELLKLTVRSRHVAAGQVNHRQQRQAIDRGTLGSRWLLQSLAEHSEQGRRLSGG